MAVPGLYNGLGVQKCRCCAQCMKRFVADVLLAFLTKK